MEIILVFVGGGPADGYGESPLRRDKPERFIAKSTVGAIGQSLALYEFQEERQPGNAIEWVYRYVRTGGFDEIRAELEGDHDTA